MTTNNNDKEYRALCEQGDLGLFGELFKAEDQKILNESDRKLANKNNED